MEAEELRHAEKPYSKASIFVLLGRFSFTLDRENLGIGCEPCHRIMTLSYISTCRVASEFMNDVMNGCAFEIQPSSAIHALLPLKLISVEGVGLLKSWKAQKANEAR